MHVQHRRQPPGDQLLAQGVEIHQGRAGGVEEGGAIAHPPQQLPGDHALGGGDVRGVEADHVGPRVQLLGLHLRRAERTDHLRLDIRVGDQHLQVEAPQMLGHQHPDAGGPDQPHHAAVVPDLRGGGGAGSHLVVPAVGMLAGQGALPGQQDLGERELRHGHGVRLGGGGHPDPAALPHRGADGRTDGAGGVHDRAQARHPGQRLRIDEGRAPAGQHDLDLGEQISIRLTCRAQVKAGALDIDLHQVLQVLQLLGAEHPRLQPLGHGQQRPGSRIRRGAGGGGRVRGHRMASRAPVSRVRSVSASRGSTAGSSPGMNSSSASRSEPSAARISKAPRHRSSRSASGWR